MAKDSKHIDHLIARFITGEATQQEVEQLDQWLDRSEVNRKYFGDIQFINQKAIASHTIINVDVDRAWNEVRKHMKGRVVSVQPEAKATAFRIPIWLRVSAVILIAFGISFAIYKLQTTKQLVESEIIAVLSEEGVVDHRLTDSTTIVVNAHSKISYHKDYGVKNRKLKLEGEAFFEVKHMDDMPFIVEAEDIMVQVLGTAFNVKAFEGDTIVEVYVRTGEVYFFTSDLDGIFLMSGEMGVFNKNTRTFSRVAKPDVNVVAYATRMFVFQNALLLDVANQLSKAYHTHIRFESEELKELSISVNFENEELDLILDIIAETLEISIAREADGFVIQSGETNSEAIEP